MKLAIIIIIILVVATIPITVNADPFNYTVTLIDEISDYDIYSRSEKIENKYIYEEQCLVIFHMPLLIQTNEPSIDLNKGQLNKLISTQLEGNINNKELNFEYFLLVNETYTFEQPHYKIIKVPSNYTYWDNATNTTITEVIYNNRSVVDYIETINDYRYRWHNINDLEEFDSKNEGFICIDIVGKTTATIEHWSVDIIPTVEVNGLQKTYPEFAWWDVAWDHYRTVKIDHDYIETDLEYFPILLELSDTIGDSCQADGDDIRFVKTDNLTEYFYEIEYWVDNSPRIVWVNVSYLTSLTDEVFLMYYGNAAATDNEHPADTWNDQYIGVWHMNSTVLNVIDSTGNIFNNGTKEGAAQPAEVVGKFGFCQDFESGTTDWISVANEASLHPVDMTLEYWACPETVANSGIVSMNSDAALTNSYVSYCVAVGGKYDSYILDDNVGVNRHMIYHNTTWDASCDSCANILTPAGIAVVGRWSHISLRYYDFTNGLGGVANMGFGLGKWWGQYFDGKIDEIRISNVIRNTSWLNLTHWVQNQSLDPIVIVIGVENSQPPLPPTGYINYTWLYPYNNTYNICFCNATVGVELYHTGGDGMNITFYAREESNPYYNIWGEFLNVNNGTYIFHMDTIGATIPSHAVGHIHGHRSVPVAGQWYNITFDDGHEVHMEADYRNTTIPAYGMYTATYWASVQDSDVTPQGHIFAIRVICNGVEVEGSYRQYTFEKKDVGGVVIGDVHSLFYPGDNLSFQYLASDTDVRITGNGTYSTDNSSFYAYIERIDIAPHKPLKYNTTYFWYVNATEWEQEVIYNRSKVFMFSSAWNFTNCTTEASESGGWGTYSWIIGIVIAFSIFGIISFIGFINKRVFKKLMNIREKRRK